MVISFPKIQKYLESLDLANADKLDIIAKELIFDEAFYEKVSQALRRRFSRGAETVEAIDRGGRLTRVKREKRGGKYRYLVLGENGDWFESNERIWIVAMYALWQAS